MFLLVRQIFIYVRKHIIRIVKVFCKIQKLSHNKH